MKRAHGNSNDNPAPGPSAGDATDNVAQIGEHEAEPIVWVKTSAAPVASISINPFDERWRDCAPRFLSRANATTEAHNQHRD